MIIISKTTNNQQHNSVAFIHTLFSLLVDTISQVRVLTSENDGYDVNDVVNDDVINFGISWSFIPLHLLFSHVLSILF